MLEDDSATPSTTVPSISMPLVSLAETLRVKYKLLPAEINQLLSHPPKTRTELVLVVEEGEERFDERVLDEMIALIALGIESCQAGGQIR
jgi:hypothetical protein